MRRTALASALLIVLGQAGGCGGRSIAYDVATGGTGARASGAGGAAGSGFEGSGERGGAGGARASSGGATGAAGRGGSFVQGDGGDTTRGTGGATSSGANGGASPSAGGATAGSGTSRGAGGHAGSGDDASGRGGTSSQGGTAGLGTGNRGGTGPGGAASGSDGDDVMNGGAAGEADAEVWGDIVKTDLVVNLDFDAVTATITLAPSSATSAMFEVGDLQLVSIEGADGNDLRWEEWSGPAPGILRVHYPPATGEVTITITYNYDEHENFDGVSHYGYTFTWPYYCGNVFPCHSDPADGTRFSMKVTGGSAPAVIYPAVIDAAAPSYMAAWAAGDYQKLDLGTTTAGTHIVAYYLADTTSGQSDMTFGTELLPEAFDWLERHYGAYTFGSEVGPVSVSWRNAADYDGMEHHPFWHLRDTAVTNWLTQIHEASHGWFGDGVRLRCWEDFVLSEGLASYLAARLVQEFGNQDYWATYTDILLDGAASDAIVAWPSGCGAIDVLTSGLDSNMTYVKGALFFRALETRIGTDAFDAALALFYARWVGRAAGVQDLLDTVKESSGYDPTACAEHWLETLGPTNDPCP